MDDHPPPEGTPETFPDGAIVAPPAPFAMELKKRARAEWPAVGLWGAAVGAFGAQAFRQERLEEALPAVGGFALLLALYLGSVLVSGEALRRWAGREAGRIYIVPFGLWLGEGLLRILRGLPLTPGFLLSSLLLLLVPTLLIRHNRAPWGPIQALIALGALAGLLLPGPFPSDPIGWAFRIGAGAWPLALMAGWPPASRPRAHLLFFTAVLFVWYAVEFDRLPSDPLLPGGPSAFYLIWIVLFLWLLLIAGRFPDLGFTFRWRRADLLAVLGNLAGFAAFALPFGRLTGFITLAPAPPDARALARLLAIYLFIGLPEEILFRGVLHVHFQRVLGWPPLRTLLLSSLLFGLAHLNNPPKVFLYAILATVAGFFYGRTYLQTGKVTAAALVHALVDALWALFFQT